MLGLGSAILPDTETAGIVTRRAVHLRVPRVFYCRLADRHIVTVGAFGGESVDAMTAGAFPTLVNLGTFLLFNHLKAMSTLVAFSAQLGRALHSRKRACGWIPE